MLTSFEKLHCRRILALLHQNDILALKDTITKGAVITKEETEAIDVILEYSVNVLELLRRRKIKRESLFQYLHNECLRVDPSSNKEVLIQHVLSYLSQSKDGDSQQQVATIRSSETFHVTSSGDHKPSPSAVSSAYSNVFEKSIAQTDQQISKEFVNWFYPMLNSLHSQCSQTETASTWSSKHFWSDCALRCKLPAEQNGSGTEFQFETYDNAELTQKRLASLVTDLHLVFNANDTPNGHRGRINSHGMAKVIACGTLHRITPLEQCSSFAKFEQLFGLLRDPTEENRWKIKCSDLSITYLSGQSSSQLSLTEQACAQLFDD